MWGRCRASSASLFTCCSASQNGVLRPKPGSCCRMMRAPAKVLGQLDHRTEQPTCRELAVPYGSSTWSPRLGLGLGTKRAGRYIRPAASGSSPVRHDHLIPAKRGGLRRPASVGTVPKEDIANKPHMRLSQQHAPPRPPSEGPAPGTPCIAHNHAYGCRNRVVSNENSKKPDVGDAAAA